MDILAETPFKILHQGLTDTIVEYKDIENDLPLHEQRKLESKPAEFKKVQTDFNSAEMYNKELRSEHSIVDSYKISEISEVYSTKKFKLFKIEQIISVCEYLQKVLKLIFNIDRQVTNLEKKTTKIANEKKFSSENDREIFPHGSPMPGVQISSLPPNFPTQPCQNDFNTLILNKFNSPKTGAQTISPNSSTQIVSLAPNLIKSYPKNISNSLISLKQYEAVKSFIKEKELSGNPADINELMESLERKRKK